MVDEVHTHAYTHTRDGGVAQKDHPSLHHSEMELCHATVDVH
jgi:hypothetical protein